MKGYRTVLLAVVLLAGLVPAALAGTTVKGDYVAGTGDVIIYCETRNVGADLCVGGYEFSANTSASTAEIVIDDLYTDKTAGYYQFEAPNGDVVGEGPICGSESPSIPSNAEHLSVFVDTGFSVVDCGVNDQPAFGTAGTIEVTWS